LPYEEIDQIDRAARFAWPGPVTLASRAEPQIHAIRTVTHALAGAQLAACRTALIFPKCLQWVESGHRRSGGRWRDDVKCRAMLCTFDCGLVSFRKLPVNLTSDRLTGIFCERAFYFGSDPKVFQLLLW
jgi:hypothetical protein